MEDRRKATQALVHDLLAECVRAEDLLLEDRQASFRVGSTEVVVSVAFDEDLDATFVHIAAFVADGVPMSGDLLRWVAEVSNELLFGRVTVDSPRAASGAQVCLQLRHALLGDFLDLAELRVATAVLAAAADHMDDAVVGRFGGRRFVDSVDS